MVTKRKIEVFSAGCPVCEQTVELIKRIACESCDVTVLDLHDTEVASQAKKLSINSVPAIVIDGKLAQCCEGRGPDEKILRTAGLGQPLV